MESVLFFIHFKVDDVNGMEEGRGGGVLLNDALIDMGCAFLTSRG
jgi:hypothetical protein